MPYTIIHLKVSKSKNKIKVPIQESYSITKNREIAHRIFRFCTTTIFLSSSTHIWAIGLPLIQARLYSANEQRGTNHESNPVPARRDPVSLVRRSFSEGGRVEHFSIKNADT